MGATVFKQPNGLLGRYSYVSDSFTNYNMTDEEYKIDSIERHLHHLNFDMQSKRFLGDYKEVVKDAREHINGLKECLQEMKNDGDDEEDIKSYEKDIKEQEKDVDDYIKLAESKDTIDENINKYYKEVYGLIERLCCSYTDEWIKKKYDIFEHEDDLKMITQKVKELNELFDAYGRLSKQNDK